MSASSSTTSTVFITRRYRHRVGGPVGRSADPAPARPADPYARRVLPFTYASPPAPVLPVRAAVAGAGRDGTAMVHGLDGPRRPDALHGTPLAFDAHGGPWCCSASRRRWRRRPAPGGTGALLALPSPPGDGRLRHLRVLAVGGRAYPCPWSAGAWSAPSPTWCGPGAPTTASGSPPSPGCGRPWSRWPGRDSPTWAGCSYASHVGGALVSVYLLSRILRVRARCCGGSASRRG